MEARRAGKASRTPYRKGRDTDDLWVEANRSFFDSAVWRTVLDDAGRRIVKYPTDLQVYREIIRKVRPEVIVETGSAEGGSASWFADLVPGVITIDVMQVPWKDERVTYITGNSVDMSQQVAEMVAGRRCLVSLDSDHNANHVRREVEAYAPLVPIGSYLVVEDTAVDAYSINEQMYPEGGPLVAITPLPHGFEADTECERFRLGMNPGGWLRRVS